MNSIVEAVFYFANKVPEKIALIDNDRKITFNELKNEVILVSDYFNQLGLKQGDKIIIECTQDSFFLVLALACHFSQCIFIPIEKNTQIDRFSEIEKIIAPDIIVASEIMYTDRKKTIFSGDISALIKDASEKDITVNDKYADERIEEIIFTSGTTGRPKGIKITNINNVSIAENIISGTEMKSDNVELVPLPLSHSHGLRTCYANLYNGSTIVIRDGIIDVGKVYKAIKENCVTALDLTPTAAKILLSLTKERLMEFQNQIEYVELGTELLEQDIKEKLKHIFPLSRLYNFYGSTESGRSCVLNFNSKNDVQFSIGVPTINAEFIIVDENKNEIISSVNNMGCIAVKGKMNTIGYWNNPQLTDETINDDYIYTKDIGYIDKQGMVFVLGRCDDLINYKGIKITPEEIESVVMNYEGIYDCACVAIDDNICGQVPVLFIQLVKKIILEDFRTYLKYKLSADRIPQKIIEVDFIPRTSNGKKNRKKLREDYKC